ncbi:MAG TPA: hypothetical protein VKT78_06475 [Fimbriimonadaceae bacterium]|nr:hypothetical protein [Fimbriimonadaceae bacterium]
MILTSLVLISASSVAYFAPSTGSSDATDKKVKGLGQSGLLSPAQAEAIRRARAAASGRTMEANSTMPGAAKENAPGPQGAKSAPPNAPNGQAAQAAPAPAPAPPAPPPPPKWRLEGTMVGGDKAPSAVFNVEGWGEVLLHPGEKINEHTVVLGIREHLVALLTDKKKVEVVMPW